MTYAAIRRLAELLGWPTARRLQHTGPTDIGVIVWYEAGDGRTCFLQVNVLPQPCACVYAPRYRLCSGWHALTAYALRQMPAEAARLQVWLGHAGFATAEARRTYRALHPECVGYSWKKLRESGPPYRVG